MGLIKLDLINLAKRMAAGKRSVKGKARVEFDNGGAWIYVDNKMVCVMPEDAYHALVRHFSEESEEK